MSANIIGLTESVGKQWTFLDYCKFFFAIVVITIHTNPFGEVENEVLSCLILYIESLAVPFFFLATGFFLQQKRMQAPARAQEYMRQYLKKIAGMYLAWTLVSLPVQIYGYVISGEDLLHCLFSYVKYFFLVGKLYNTYHLWYLLALIYGLIWIGFWLRKSKTISWITIASGILYVCNEGMQFLAKETIQLPGAVRAGVHVFTFLFNSGGIFQGAFFVSIGMLIAERNRVLKKWVCLLAMLLIYGIELWITGAENQICVIISSVLCFMWTLGVSCKEDDRGVICRQMSTWMYCSHLLFVSFYTIVIIGEPNRLGVDTFLVTLIGTLVLAYGMIKLKQRR